MSSYSYVCPNAPAYVSYIRVLILLHTCPRTPTCASSYCHIRVLILLCTCPHTPMCPYITLLSSSQAPLVAFSYVLWRSRDFIVGIVVFRYFLVPRMDLGVDDVIIKSKGKRFGKEKLFFLQEELRITKVCTKKPTSESALRAYDPTISILSSNELRFKIRRCRVDEARHSTIELTWQVKLWRDPWFLCRWDLTTSQPTVRFIKALNLAVKQACTCLFMLCLLHLFGYQYRMLQIQ